MYKVKYIANGMIIWKDNVVIGIKGLTLPEIFNDCDCYKLQGNAFDYALAPNQKFNDEQLAFINQANQEWIEGESEEIEEFERTEQPSKLDGDAFFDLQEDDLPF